ncbi:MAG: Outer membrane autotransporter barrel domain-containing protein [candidate division WS6 bacterium GW2011_GWF2_39_15]|uniref:Outer membrane autotransporter barrel domain-containing protein n=1 Tax=candidate division WS6 bacterium GW2011_GWF2_39_15 TaxID=1619100 RepID=A0A0G0Q7I8_9BACT|nr:MAG: Outer membrane autotransporter barrel domain-containing protein [candidate division WS6 bacterium GW2011_GWF2_39_15]
MTIRILDLMLQRVPNYTDVTVNSSINWYPDDWIQPDGTINNGKGEGGVIFFRATGSVSINGTIHANAKGYIGFYDNDAGYDTNGSAAGGNGGESLCGVGGAGGYIAAGSIAYGSNGAAGGGAGYYNTTLYQGGNGYCGGGGGSTNSVSGGVGSSSSGGAGGGGSGYDGGGGGGGYGGYGIAGSYSLTSTQRGVDGGINTSGNGGYGGAGIGGGGGGGSYGTADLSKMFFGSAGGEGGEYTHNASDHFPGKGGDGGGIVSIAANSVTVSGNLQVNGENGGNGVNGASLYGGGGGGGAGGSIKIVSNTANLGASKTSATGGIRGIGYNSGATNDSYNGGAGGDGRIAVFYLNSYSGSGVTPGAEVASQPSNTYGVYISDEINTPKASGFGQIRWHSDLNKYGLIEIQTRSGASNNSTDGTWEGWKPVVVDTNEKSIETADTHTNWSGTNVTVSEGDVTRNVDYYEDEDETTVADITKMVSSTNGGYSEATISSLSLADFDYISIWVRASQTGGTIKLGFGESTSTENEMTVGMDTVDTWQKVYWDISDVPSYQRNAITKLRITNLTSSSNIFYIDNMVGGRYMRSEGGSTVTSTASDYMQYRIIFSTSEVGYKPTLYNVKLSWSNGYKVEMTDANTARIYNYSGESQELRLSVTGAGGSSGGDSDWATVGANIYRATGKVGIGDSTPDVELKVVGALCVKSNADDCAGATAGTIYANNTSVQSADLAEMYKVSDLTIEPGDLVSLDPNTVGEVQKSDLDNISNLMGVVSTAPGLLMNDERSDNARPVGLIGRLPMKVMTTGRSVAKGDVITASVLPGIGAVRKDPGMVVAKALEDTLDWADSVCQSVSGIEDIKWPKDNGKNELKPCFVVPVDSFDKSVRESLFAQYNLTSSDSIYIGKIMAFVDVVWYQPQWISDDIAKMVGDYNAGAFGGSGGGWKIEENGISTSREVNVASITGTKGDFNILNTGLLNIGDGSVTADSGGNLGVAGDLTLNGRLKSNNGSIVLEIGDGENDLFVIKNAKGETLFSVNPSGQIGGKGTYRGEWTKINPNDSIKVSHNFNATPSQISIIKSDNIQGYGFTSKGLGSEYYYEYYDNNSIQVYNKTGQAIYVKLTIER